MLVMESAPLSVSPFADEQATRLNNAANKTSKKIDRLTFLEYIYFLQN
jgi:hypothetical protein